MKIIERYFIKESVIYSSICLLVFISILLTVRILRFAGLIVNRGVLFSQIANLFAAIIPSFLELAIPMSVLLGIMLAAARLSGDSEIIVMRASGISIFQLAKATVMIGVVALVLSYLTSVYLRPWGSRKLSQALFEIARTRSTSGLEQGIFNKLGGITIFAQDINYQERLLSKVILDDKRDAEQRKLVLANSGRIVSDTDNQTISFELQDGVIHEIRGASYGVTHFQTNIFNITPDQLFNQADSKKIRPVREYSTTELIRAVRAGPSPEVEQTLPISENATEIQPIIDKEESSIRLFRRIKSELGNRLAMPFSAFILAIMALPLGILPPRTHRSWGAGPSIVLALLVFACYYGSLSVAIALGESGYINPLLGLWVPNLVCSILAGYLLYKISTEQWDSVSDSFVEVYERLRHLFRSTSKQ